MNPSQNMNSVKVNKNMYLVVTIGIYNIVLNCEQFLMAEAV